MYHFISICEFKLEFRVGVNSIPELELRLNSNSNSGIGIGIGIEISWIENGIGIENPGIGIGIGIGIENWNWIFCNCYRSNNQPFPNFSFNRGGHNLSCDWLLMQQVFLGHLPPCGVATKDTGAGYLIPLEWTEARRIRDCDNKLPAWHKHNYYHCWINEWFQGLGWNYPNIQVSVSFYWLVSSVLLW